MNVILHSIDVPNIIRINKLTESLSNTQEKKLL